MDRDQALALHRRGDLDRAAAAYEEILDANPDDAVAHHLLGLAAHQSGDAARAERHLRRAIALDDTQAAAHHHLGLALRQQQRLEEAAAAFERSLALEPASIDGLVQLADVRQLQGDLAGASAAYDKALRRDAQRVDAWWGLGCLEAARGEHAAAAALLTRTVALAPTWGEAHHNLGRSLFELGQIDTALDVLRRAATLLPGDDRSLGTIATIIPGSARADDRAVAEARRLWAAASPTPPARAAARPAAHGGARLRIGYLSAFFAHRNWMKPVWGLINHHDRDRVEVHLFGDGVRPSREHGYRADPRDRIHDLTGLPTSDAARAIEEAQLDLLIDLNAYSRIQRVPLLARRPAPILVAWFNLFAPSGLEAYDYVIGDRHVLPASERDAHGDRVVRLRGSYLTFDVAYPTPDVAPPPCASRPHVTFGALCPQYKITPEVVSAWARILNGAPGTRLLIRNTILGAASNRRFVTEQFAAHGIASERLDLLGPAEHHAFLATYAEVDAALDPFPYNGGTTTMEALWQGVPVLTFSGDRWAARIGASLLHNAGLSELVAGSIEDHIAMAIALARDPATPARLTELRRTMRDRLRRSSVCDIGRFVRDMERLYARIHRIGPRRR